MTVAEETTYFQPLDVVRSIQDDYLRYLLTTFPVTGSLRNILKERLKEDAAPWQGPFITISQAYRHGAEVHQILHELQMDPILAGFIPSRLFKHQEDVLRNIALGRNTIVTTGTGSGKTESFLLPILDYCIKHDEPGLKAILLYPMNSLAEDQADRLRRYLFTINLTLGRRPITFARYTGATPTIWDEGKMGDVRCPLSEMANTQGQRRCQTCSGGQLGEAVLRAATLVNGRKALICSHESPPPITIEYELLTREDIHARPPDILITNYKMLELLLLRREDRVLFSGALRYVVADELHSYLGAQGTELSCLLRRLGARMRVCGGREPLFIGASATIITDPGANLKREVARYGSDFFGVRLVDADIITGETETRTFTGEEWKHSVPSRDPGIGLDGSEQEFRTILESICPADRIPAILPHKIEERRYVLGRMLLQNSLFRHLALRLTAPRSLASVVDELKKEGRDARVDEKEVLRILSLAAQAYDPISREIGPIPLVRCQVHFVARTLDGVYKCTKCGSLHFTPRLTCPGCRGSVEALAVCRSCGAEFLRVDLREEDYRHFISQDIEDIDRALDDETPWQARRADVLREPYGATSTTVWLSEIEPPARGGGQPLRIGRCASCGTIRHNADQPCCQLEDVRNAWLFKKVYSCPFCLDKRGPYSQPISTLYLSPRTAAPTLFALTHSAVRSPAHRKQLIFADSRQETARLAGFMDDLHMGILVRNLAHEITLSRRKGGLISFPELVKAIINRLFDLGYRDDEEDEVFGLERDRIIRQVQEELAGCFNKRYGVEKVGLINAFYPTIDSPEFLQDVKSGRYPLLRRVQDISGRAPEAIRDTLAMMLDHMRQEGGMRCLREFRPWATVPAAFVELNRDKRRDSLYFKVYNIKRGSRPSRSSKKPVGLVFFPHTVFSSFIERAFDLRDGLRQNEVLECLFRYLQQSEFLVLEEIGQRRRTGQRERGWTVDETKVFFKIPKIVNECPTCGDRSERAIQATCCFTYRCPGGTPVSKTRQDLLREDDIYIKRYSVEQPVRLITAEDHGGLDDMGRKKIETGFKQKKIDVICCTPTLELGVDIGDLSIVGLYRMPPSPANYIQRVGRAGRRDRISLALTFLAQNPIDQYYRRRPLEMIAGVVRLPYVNLENDTIVGRHVNSLIFEILTVTGGFVLEKRVLDFKNSDQLRQLEQHLRGRRKEISQGIRKTFAGIPCLPDWKIDRMCDEFSSTIDDAIRQWGERRERLLKLMDELQQKQMEANRRGNMAEAEEYLKRAREIQRQLSEMQGDERGESDLFSYLSGMGVLPTYTFPTKLVRIQDRWGRDLGNDRPASSAITEYAPGLSVDMRKSKYRVLGFDTVTVPEPTGRTIYICDQAKGGCGRHASLSQSSCPICRVPDAKLRMSIVHAWRPSSLVLDREDRISIRGEEEFKLADPEYYRLSSDGSEAVRYDTSWAEILDKGASDILLLVRRTTDMSDRTGFDICTVCGWCLQGQPVRQGLTTQHNRLSDRRVPCEGRVEKKALWHLFRTNALELMPNPGVAGNDSRRWLITLKNALCRTAEIMINAAEGELEGFVSGSALVIFDNVDGGVGYTRQLASRIGQIELEMALTVLSCDCETGCPRCIYSFRRKIDVIRGDVDKRLIVPLCQAILRSHMPSRPAPTQRREQALENLGVGSVQGNVSGWFSIVDDRRPGTWLRDIIYQAKEEVCATSLYITDDVLAWADSGTGNFAELLTLSRSRGIKVRIIVRAPQSEKHFRILHRLSERGVEVRIFSQPSQTGMTAIAHCKLVVVDGNTRSDTSAGITLSANLSGEVQKNVDFFCLGVEQPWIDGLQRAFEILWSEAGPLN